MKHYKIKVGIEEYPIDEIDIPRIVEAMKNNDMVKLDCGIFRGQSILAVARDIEKESSVSMIQIPALDSQEHIERKRIEQQIYECTICGKESGYSKGWIINKNEKGERIAKRCVCTQLPALA